MADALLGLIERGIRMRRRAWIWLGVALLVGGAGAALAPRLVPQRAVVTIGAKNFSEQYILARLVGRHLEAAGYRVRYREGLGSAVIFRALAAGDVDVYVDYAGTIWTNEMKRREVPDPARMVAAIGEWAAREHGVGLVGALGFENAYAIAVRGADAQRLGLRTLDDLARAAPRMVLGSDLEFLERPEWAAVRDAYALRFAATRAYSPTFMYRAIDSGAVDAISAFSSDGRIAAQKLVVLADPRHAIPSYDALLLVSPGHSNDARFSAALKPLVGRITIEAMRAANYSVDRDSGKRTPDQAAAWLDTQLR
jgi:osmoprotectant transport system permease protein